MGTNLENITQRVEASLESIRPYLNADGGDIKITEISDDLVVKLEFLGACGNCKMSTMTFKAGVVEAIKRAVPEVASIEVINLTAA